MIEGSVTDKMYHGCAIGYTNDKRKLIDFEKGESCLMPTDDPFWTELQNCKMQAGTQKKIDNCYT